MAKKLLLLLLALSLLLSSCSYQVVEDPEERTIFGAGQTAYALEADGENIYGCDLTGDIALVVGGENSGVAALTKKKCDKILSLPLKGKVNSLNASVALGIAAYEAVRQRQ